MKRISTLLTALAVVLAVPAKAQFYENFDDLNKFSGSCWTFNEMWGTNYAPWLINGTYSLITNPTTTDSETRDVITPYLNITSTSFTVRFNYMLNAVINTPKAQRTIEIGLEDASGYTPLDLITIDKNTPDQTLITPYDSTFTLPATGSKRLVIRMGGSTGVGVVRVIIDDLYASANALYTTNGGCNSAPIAVPDNFIAPLMMPYSDNVITNTVGGTDNEPNGETLAATLVSQPPASVGTVTLDNNGDFTFTPAPGFTGGPVTFSYRLTDNGFAPLLSNTATVTIEYPAPLVVLPVRLMNFSGEWLHNKAQLSWAVAENQSGAYFEVLRSRDGKTFTSAGLVFASGKDGSESYQFSEKAETDGATYYRLKLVSKNGGHSLSNVIVLKKETTTPGSTLRMLQNPVASTLHFTYLSSTTTASQVVIYSMGGVKVFSTIVGSQKGNNTVSLELNRHLTPGTYILEVSCGSERKVTKLVKQ